MARQIFGPLAGGILQFIVTLLLSIVYIVVFIPIGLALRIAGKDPLSRKWDASASSYWLVRKGGSSRS